MPTSRAGHRILLQHAGRLRCLLFEFWVDSAELTDVESEFAVLTDVVSAFAVLTDDVSDLAELTDVESESGELTDLVGHGHLPAVAHRPRPGSSSSARDAT